MTQPLRWLWGLVPLALLWTVGNVVLDEPIQQDVGRRAATVASAAAGSTPGARPISARVAGRDVAISGEALTADGAAKALVQLRSEFGIRRALGGLSQVVAQNPYSWSAIRQAQSVALNGFVPDEATAVGNVAAAAAAFPGLRIDDRQQLAFGAPAGFAAMTQAILAEMPKLATGKVALDGTRFCIEGTAATPEGFLALKAATPGLAGTGFQAVDCALDPPVVAPYRWSAERLAGGGVAITGFYPSETVRAAILALLRGGFPEPARIEDRMLPVRGAPASFLARVTRAVGELGRLRSGKAELSGDVYALSGEGPESFEACQALRLQIAQLDGPDSVAQATIGCPPAPPPLPPMPALPEIPPLFVPVEPAVPAPAATTEPPPPAAPTPPPPAAPVVAPAPAPSVPLRWQARKGDQGLLVTGAVRDDAAREILRASAGRAKASAFEDRTTLEPNLTGEPDYAAATRFAFELLGAMLRGSVELSGTQLTVSGDVGDLDGMRALEAALAQQPLPAGLTTSAGLTTLALRPYPFSISVDRSGATLSGYLPDAQTRDALVALVEASPFKGKLSDEVALAPSAPPGFTAAARLALVNLLRLDLGSASVTEAGVILRGLTCRELIKSEVETSAAEPGAALRMDAVIGLRQTGCVIDPPNTCQNDLDALTKRNTVLFGQGTAVVALDATTERVIGEAYDILRQCPASRITVEGHANRDGDIRGFNNRDLSQRRAMRVRDELVRRGIEPAQLAVEGFGTERPLVPHGAPDARVMNRRVQFTVAK